jgi:NTP pyrophosphatase (non-canonical NTP hydrolase)
MELNKYQEQAMTTCMPSCKNISYMLLNLVGEVGEFSSKIAKGIRKGQFTIGGEGKVQANQLIFWKEDIDKFANFEKIQDELKKEAGDILWQLSGLCAAMDWTLEDVAQMNLDKLAARKKAGTIDGNGDGVIRDK